MRVDIGVLVRGLFVEVVPIAPPNVTTETVNAFWIAHEHTAAVTLGLEGYASRGLCFWLASSILSCCFRYRKIFTLQLYHQQSAVRRVCNGRYSPRPKLVVTKGNVGFVAPLVKERILEQVRYVSFVLAPSDIFFSYVDFVATAAVYYSDRTENMQYSSNSNIKSMAVLRLFCLRVKGRETKSTSSWKYI